MKKSIVLLSCLASWGCGADAFQVADTPPPVASSSGSDILGANGSSGTCTSDPVVDRIVNLCPGNNAGSGSTVLPTSGSMSGSSGGSGSNSGTADLAVDSGSPTLADAGMTTADTGTDLCANVSCPAGEVCQSGLCMCDGPLPPPNDAGTDAGSCDAATDCHDATKTLLCHYPPGNVANMHNICVGNPAVPAHLAHGDVLGCCPVVIR